MTTFFVVERRDGPDWDPSQPLEGQSGWVEHAAFMDDLVDAGVVVLGGPLADERRVVLVVEAPSEEEVQAVLGRDPWSGSHLVVASVDAWPSASTGGTAERVGSGDSRRGSLALLTAIIGYSAGSAFGAHAAGSPPPGVDSADVGGAVNHRAEVHASTV